MANPSLQIGNSNWAIKEDNLLGYSTAGTRFVPQPITMTRASAGTRVNSSGLVEDVELLGSELVTNGDFASGTTDWTPNASATLSIDSDRLKINVSGAGSGYAHQTFTVENGKKYKCTGTIDFGTASQMRFYVSNPGQFFDITQSGNFDFTFTSTGTSTQVRLYTYGDGNYGFWDNISIKESTKNNLARVDYDGTASSLLVEPERTNDITNSETFGSTGWSQVLTGTAISPIVTDNYAISPDGTQNAQRIQFNLGGSSPSRTVIRQSISTQTDWFLSVYMKSTDGTDQKILWHSTSDTNETTVTADWKRFTLSRNGGSNSWAGLCLNGGVSTVNTADILVYGFQAEQGSYPTSLIPTDGGTVTRVQDQYSKTGISNLINSEEGVLFVEFENIVDSAAAVTMLSLSDGSATNKIGLFVSGGQISVESAGSGTNLGIYSKTLQSGFNKIAVKYKVNDCALWVNGTEYTDTSFTAFSSSTLNSLVFDRGDAGQPFFGKVKQLQVYKTTDIDLAALTS